MSNKAQRVLESLQKNCPKSVYLRLTENLPPLSDTLTEVAQRKIISTLLCGLESTCGKDACASVMRPCGYACLSAAVIDKARKLYRKVNQDLPALLVELNELGIGGGAMRYEGGVILATYTHCYCGIAKPRKDLPTTYCECSAGWFEKLFSTILGTAVRVHIRATILSGAPSCQFEIIPGNM